MVTSAFLLNVVIYGLIASLVIPVIDFLMVIVRESRKPNRLDASQSTLNEWHPSASAPARERKPAAHVAIPQAPPEVAEKPESAPVSGQFVKQNGTVAYMASNGVTITAGVRRAPRPNHPHAGYWEYSNVSFYEA